MRETSQWQCRQEQSPASNPERIIKATRRERATRAVKRWRPALTVKVKLHTVADPVPEAGDVLLAVRATSMCGTDSHIYDWNNWARQRIKPPRILGHEMFGEVVAVGKGVSSVRVGDRVAAESHVTCGKCFQCRTGNAHVCKNYTILGLDRDGSFAQFVAIPEAVCWKTAEEIP